ncbi:helix-turn-helix transcriptional regulator [Pseudoduganella danionis]|uniref:AlpA family phage regulatory protein n=1 Tax=Pseudoduganella danionis TaxID=1890295 RepID=A0ABW9SRD6_9BURK|nr:AlpA family phage regulatory protein [Pseudoduganella danionis]
MPAISNTPTPITTPAIPKVLLDVLEVCHSANISRQFLYKLWSQGEGPKRIKLGVRTLVRTADLEAWVQSLDVSEVDA